MNTQKILELLGTTSDKKMETLKREMTFPATAEESANDLLNAELYGTKKAALEGLRKPAIRKSTLHRPAKRATESASNSSIIPTPFDKYYDVVSLDRILKEYGWTKEELAEQAGSGKNGIFGVEDLRSYSGLKHIAWLFAKPQYRERLSADGYELVELVKDGTEKHLYITSGREAMEVDDDILDLLGGSERATESVNQGGKRFDACPKEAQDFLFKLLDVISSGDCKKAKHMLLEFIGMVPASSTEMVVEAQTENFPSTFDFDEEKFAEDYDIDKDSITCIHIAEDPEAKVQEHIEVSFKAVEDGEESTVVLSIAPDMLVSETIDAEVIDPAQFSATFVEEENEQGEMRTRLVLTLVDDDEEEETDVVMSEGDVDHVDENGDATTDEFIEEAGLNLDPFYSKQHNIKVADKGAHESLATKIIRSRK